MYNRPLDNDQAENEIVENENTVSNYDSSYGYNDNLTAKLGGNYAKIIEFYDSRL